MATRLGRFEMPKQVVKDDAVSTENYGKFYNLLGLVKGKYGKRIKASRWEILRSGLGTEFQFGTRYFTMKLV